ncbi:fucose isomerase [Bacteroides sp. 224]|uniref:fucose isomerase n=1 Tax=Bacteroides sp. 224 TaxID=2302936 RepID=UPI0013D29B3B|nr:fucose isomerase [Bacteroides sp. 224]NDV64860.1 fucose isomerase [Bacteroides sp. 224]
MTLNLITFASALNKNVTVQTAHELILSELENHFSINFVDHKDIQKLTQDDFSIIFIATGGVERLVMQSFEFLPRPVVMLADGMQNSLAAALEISSWLRSRGIKSEILHGEVKAIIRRIQALSKNFQAERSLAKKRVGVIGTPSSWLISSNVDYLLAKRRWGVQYIDISLENVQERFAQISDDEVGEACVVFTNKALACREGSPEDLIKAMRLYRAIKQICTEENLDAITLSCFKLMDLTETTGCLALSLLNDEGILAGCEGDLQSIFTLLVIQALTGKTGFMANPSMINSKTNEVIFAHCTIGVKQAEQYIIRNHFESETGIAIQGILPTGVVTIVKCGGESLDEYYLASGMLTENTNYINMCRTQVRIKLNNSAGYYLKNPLGNHHIVIQGDCVDILNDFFHANSCKRIE